MMKKISSGGYLYLVQIQGTDRFFLGHSEKQGEVYIKETMTLPLSIVYEVAVKNRLKSYHAVNDLFFQAEKWRAFEYKEVEKVIAALEREKKPEETQNSPLFVVFLPVVIGFFVVLLLLGVLRNCQEKSRRQQEQQPSVTLPEE